MDDVPLRLCVDQFLPDHLLAQAGQMAARERPGDALQLDPHTITPPGIQLASIAEPEDRSHLLYQRLGMLRQAKWEIGRTITIGFYSDLPAGVSAQVMAILEQCLAHGNLSWRQVPVSQAEYRVAGKRGAGLWSMIGNQSLSVRGQPTCNIGDVNWSDPRDLRRVVFHEICPGHGAGSLHTQSLPGYSQIIDLDEPAIIAYYMGSQGWSRQQAQAQFEKVSMAAVEASNRETRTSIMAYEVNPRFDRRGVGIPFNWEPDAEDWSQYGRSYPLAVVPPLPPPGPPPVTGNGDISVLVPGVTVSADWVAGVPEPFSVVLNQRSNVTVWVSPNGSPEEMTVDAVSMSDGRTLRLRPERSPDRTWKVTFGGPPGIYHIVFLPRPSLQSGRMNVAMTLDPNVARGSGLV